MTAPASSLTAEQVADTMRRVREAVASRVIGQDAAIEALVVAGAGRSGRCWGGLRGHQDTVGRGADTVHVVSVVKEWLWPHSQAPAQYPRDRQAGMMWP